MSHRNSVILSGPFQLVSMEVVGGSGVEMPVVVATVQTGPANKGGVHRVLLYGRDAKIASSYIEAYGGDGMEVTIYGQLRSGSPMAEVHVERITFHVHTEVINQAKETIRVLEENWSELGG